jgi:hypothetical protein
MTNKKQVLICDKCGAENWNLASVGKSHDQEANAVKGYDACNGVWRLPDRRQSGVVIQFPTAKRWADECPCDCHRADAGGLVCSRCAPNHGPAD